MTFGTASVLCKLAEERTFEPANSMRRLTILRLKVTIFPSN